MWCFSPSDFLPSDPLPHGRPLDYGHDVRLLVYASLHPSIDYGIIQESKILHFVDFLGKKVCPLVQSTDCIQP